MVQWVKNPHTMEETQETRVRSLCREDSPKNEYGNPLQYSSLENPVDRGAWWAAVYRVTQSRARLKRLSMHACIRGGNGNPLQYSCLENPRDRGAWWAAIYGAAQSRTRLKQLSSSSSRGNLLQRCKRDLYKVI